MNYDKSGYDQYMKYLKNDNYYDENYGERISKVVGGINNKK